MSKPTASEIENRFGFHPATPEVMSKYSEIRNQFTDLALSITEKTPSSREQSLFLTALQEAQMWAISSIALNETPLAGQTGLRY